MASEKTKQLISQLSKNTKGLKYIKGNVDDSIDNLLKKGIEVTQSDIAIIYDELMSIPVIELKRFYNLLASQRADVVNGVRYVYPIKGQSLRQLNIIGNIIFSSIYSWLLKQKVTDPLCMIKAFYVRDYLKSKVSKDNTSLDLLIKVAEKKGKIREIPVHYNSKVYLTYKPQTIKTVLALSVGIFYGLWRLKIYSPMAKTLKFN